MAENAEQKSWREITAELDDDDKALCGIASPEQEQELVKDGSGFHHHRYDKTPSHAPGWAKKNWWAAEKALKSRGAKDAIVRMVVHVKISDLLSLNECLRRMPSARLAWERWHSEWVAAEVARIVAEHGTRSKRDPSSERSILASLTDRQRRTWQSYRKHCTRLSRGKGQRQRTPSKQKLAIRAWESAHADDAALLRGLIVEKERIALLARNAGLKHGAFLERLKLALDNLQAAVGKAASLKGPQKVPLEISRRHAKPRSVFLIQ